MMRYPDTKTIVEHIYNDYMQRCLMVCYQNKTMCLQKEFTGWCDETWLCDMAEDMMKAYNNKEFCDIQESEISSLMTKYESEDIFELVEDYFYFNKKIIRICYPADDNTPVDPTLLQFVEKHKKDLHEQLEQIKQIYNKALEDQPKNNE